MAILSGGVAGGQRLRSIVKRAQADQRRIVSEGKPQHNKLQTQQSFGGVTRVKQKIAVDKLFFQRLVKILSMWVTAHRPAPVFGLIARRTQPCLSLGSHSVGSNLEHLWSIFGGSCSFDMTGDR